MNNAEQQVRSYLGALGERDFELARTLLADRGFSYSSPIGNFNDADQFIKSISAIGPILDKLSIRRLFVSGGEVMTILDARITLRGYVTRTSAILFRVVNGRITAMEAIFDASEYHKMFDAQD